MLLKADDSASVKADDSAFVRDDDSAFVGDNSKLTFIILVSTSNNNKSGRAKYRGQENNTTWDENEAFSRRTRRKAL